MATAGDQTVIKQGYMLRWTKEADKKKSVNWEKLFFVLHGPSLKNAARLDWYDTEKQFKQSPGMRKALFLEEVKDCHKISYTQESKELYGSSAKYILMIQTQRTSIPTFVLKCDSQDLLTEWYNHLTELLQRIRAMSVATKTPDRIIDPNCVYSPDVPVFGPSSYEVQVDDTGAAASCGLKGIYRLLLSQQHITLVDPDTGDQIITWMYKHIRRFGYSENSLSIEGGSKCGIGQGLFIFITDRGVELMKAINEQVQLCKNPKKEEDVCSSLNLRGNSTEKQSSQRPLINIDEQNGEAASSDQTKMSEVLSMLSRHDLQGAEDDTYGYSHINLRGTVQKSHMMEDLENLYGELLVQKIKGSK